MGIAGAGNSGTVLAALFAPVLAAIFGWNNVFGLALIPLVLSPHHLRQRGEERAQPPDTRRWPTTLRRHWATATAGGSCSSTA